MKDLSPPHVQEADKPLRRAVALAYRAGRQAWKSHRAAYEDAMAVYDTERPGEERLAASACVSEMIVSAISIDPQWFWRGVPSA
jgi:hypothetical protein